MVKDLRIWLFGIVLFLLGSIHVLYNVLFYIVLICAFLINVKTNFKGFVDDIRKEWRYLILPVVGCAYLVVHYLFSLGTTEYKVSWKMAEPLLLYFWMIPLYLLSAKRFMTPLFLWRALKAFCWGVLLFNFAKLFCLTGASIFIEPAKAFSLVYSGRFGCNMELLGGFVYLEPQAVYICASALIAYFALLKFDRSTCGTWELMGSVFILVFSLIFLSFTVTKGAVLAFCAGMLFLSVVYFRKKSLRFRLSFIGLLVTVAVGVYLFLPKAYIARINSMKQEIENIREGNYAGGSVAPRLGLMKENFSHWDEFGLWGLGVYKDAKTEEWYSNSSYKLSGIHNAHNTFVEYWLEGGILGLLFILFYFFGPLLRMMRNKHCLYLAIAVILSMFVAANTCVIANLEDSIPVVVFMLAIFYLYQDYLLKIQNNEY